MRAYGLIEGRRYAHVTEIGEKIARHRDKKEYKEALVKAFRNIPLWDFLYDMFTEKVKILMIDFCLSYKHTAISIPQRSKRKSTRSEKAIRLRR
jgi:hypothetical protein